MIRLRLVGILGVAACATPEPLPVSPTAPNAASTSAPAATAAATAPIAAFPPIAASGEQLTYRVSLHGVEVGEYVVRVGEAVSLDGIDALVLESSARTSRIAALLRPIQDDFASWVDRATGRSIQFTASEMAGRDDQVQERTEARFAGDRVEVRAARAGVERVEDQPLRGPGYDFLSFLMYLRGWDPPRGTRLEADVLRSRYVWRVQVVAAGYENRDTALGRVAVARYDGESVRTQRDGQIDPRSDHRRWSMWISDDADRVPLEIAARTDYGSVTMALIAYRPGAATAR